ncbi:hypothetical protein [Flammeovirga sp. OC4]|uniref:hypothetical protein n=1 Tax=Flammeovirga sp. OC4 TaxID=1382345 RepID=UPI0005C6DA3D|nr:hypothetical protein [Flammeovirga sp. OC4]
MKKLLILLCLLASTQLFAQNDILIKNVDVFDGKNEKLKKGVDVLIHGNKVQKIAKNIDADMILVDGNPLENLDLVADPENNFLMIMKDGVIYKNTINQ